VRGGCGGWRFIDISELERGLRNFGVRLTDNQITELYRHLAQPNQVPQGQVPQGQVPSRHGVRLDMLFNAVRPCLSSSRADIIETVYCRIDSDCDGLITFGDIEVGCIFT
jgi:hypothetical protein